MEGWVGKFCINMGSNLTSTLSSSANINHLSGTILGGISPELTGITGLISKKNSTGIYNFDIKDVNLQTSVYGRIIPEIFGKMRVSGNVIWCSGIKKQYSKSAVVRDKYGNVSGGQSQTSYSTSLAIAICKGIVSDITGFYADGQRINPDKLDISIYYGTEDQMPNSVIQSFEGVEGAPAFREICYVVLHNFSLNDYDGRIPNFAFDVVKEKTALDSVNNLVKSVCVIPGSGEFVYDTQVQYKCNPVYSLGQIVGYQKGEPINYNNSSGNSDAVLAFSQMKSNLPNLEYVSLVCTWFGSNLNAAECEIEPKVEYKNAKTFPGEWAVGNFTRSNAKEVSRDNDGNLRYGGTPADESVVRFAQHVRNSGVKMCFYPMLMLDIEGKPWRGRVTATLDGIDIFYEKYRTFILHYANLLRGKVDAFIIGSEMIGLTKVHDNHGNFPFVDKLCTLAMEVKEILGKNVVITYAADWSEYHHTDGGWYNLDKLWANSAIDVIGIDAYFPLTNSANSVYNIEEIQKGWESGEGYEFYYENDKTNPKYFDMKDKWSYRWGWKNIRCFWENEHFNPDGTKTLWQAKMKKIWFTEYGFPSVSCCTNQPNAFYSPGSLDAKFPYLSDGYVDFKAQKAAIIATEEFWKNSEFLEQKFLWTYDMRPYPHFPVLKNWLDGGDWRYGHWINGKLFSNRISDILEYLCLESGIPIQDFIMNDIDNYVDGILINYKTNALELLNMLADVYDFDVFPLADKIYCKKYDNQTYLTINIDDIVSFENANDYMQNVQNVQNLPNKIDMLFIDNQDFRISTVSVKNFGGEKKYSTKIPLAMSQEDARNLSGKLLNKIFIEKDEFFFSIPMKFANLQISDIVELELENTIKHCIRITAIELDFEKNCINITAVSAVKYLQNSSAIPTSPQEINTLAIPGNTDIKLYNIPYLNLSGDKKNIVKILCSVNGVLENWSGCDIYYKINGADYNFLRRIEIQSVTGTVIKNFTKSTENSIIDLVNVVQISLNDEALLVNIDEEKLGEENLAIIGNEVISFRNIRYISDSCIEISGIKRGIYGTYEPFHAAGEDFVMLNSCFELDLPVNLAGKNLVFKAASLQQSLQDAQELKFAIKPSTITALKVENCAFFKLKNGDILISWLPIFTSNIDFWNGVTSNIYNIYIYNSAGEVIKNYHKYSGNNLIFTLAEQLELFKKEIYEPDVVIYLSI